MVAPRATVSGGRWFVGSFEHTLPPIVPRLRTWTSATCAQTSPRIGRARASYGVAPQVGLEPTTLRLTADLGDVSLGPPRVVEPFQVTRAHRRSGGRGTKSGTKSRCGPRCSAPSSEGSSR